jgi:hypothetical protein
VKAEPKIDHEFYAEIASLRAQLAYYKSLVK